MKIVEQSRRALPKNYIRLFRCKISKEKGSEDLVSHSPLHADAPDGEDYGGVVAARRGKTLTQIRLIFREGG